MILRSVDLVGPHEEENAGKKLEIIIYVRVRVVDFLQLVLRILLTQFILVLLQ